MLRTSFQLSSYVIAPLLILCCLFFQIEGVIKAKCKHVYSFVQKAIRPGGKVGHIELDKAEYLQTPCDSNQPQAMFIF